ncbi:hypothetical protein [Comamonas endophytica]|uniref:Tir chaperone family protein CesT n=1 Tax=Comamonas endophytica TaxID=2949090 RepID=A0ABY6GE56_9BURK|nr:MULTISPECIES: hypothetical protein [unclassified Acidovorax]MCD2512850.1 hypothetical protein [Acidovorax sp. D4N7]UYG52802.1 hypothetical protein M9799_06060 [Acidovorax sp. 5MLIR]
MEQVLAEFGQDIGLAGLAPGASGEVQLRLESDALLGVSAHGEEAVVHYAEPVPYGAAALTFKAMQRAAQTDSVNERIQVGLRTTAQGDWLVVASRLPLRHLDAREVHRIGMHLQGWLAFVRKAL